MSWLMHLDAAATVFWKHMGEAAWQAAALALLVLLVVSFGRKWPSPLRHGLLLIALLKFAIPPVLPAPAGFFPWIDQGLDSLGPWTAPMATEAPASQAALVPVEASPQAPVNIAVTAPRVTIWTWMLGVYAFGVLVMVTRQILGHRQLRRWVASARPVDDPAILAFYVEMSQRLGLERWPQLLVSDQDEVAPMAFGVWRPVILLPAQAVDELDTEALRAVVTHELAHHARGDLWVQTVQNALAVIWWFHPFFHVLARQIRSAREDCCDDLLLGRGLVRGRGYCDAILNAADLVTAPIPAASLGFADRIHPLGRRLRRILDPTLRRTPRLSALSVALLIAVAIGALPGRMLGGPLGDAVDRIESQVEYFADHELMRAWPAFTLSRIASAPSSDVRLESLTLSENVVQMRGSAGTTNSVATLLEYLDGPSVLDIQATSIQAYEGGYRFDFDLGFDWSSEALSVLAQEGDVEARVGQLENQRDSQLGSLPASRTETLMSIRQVLDALPWHMERLSPLALRHRGPYDEWPITVEGVGAFEDIHQLLVSLSRVPGLSYESLQLEPAEEEGIRMTATLFVLLRSESATGADQAVTGGRRFGGELEQVQQALSVISVAEAAQEGSSRDPFER